MMSEEELVVFKKIIDRAIERGDGAFILRHVQGLHNGIAELKSKIDTLEGDLVNAKKLQGEYKQGRRDAFVMKVFESFYKGGAHYLYKDIATITVNMADLLISEMDSSNVEILNESSN
jgi:uncharacterized protein Veg